MTTPSPYPAGWYDDSTRPGWQRWWDGQRWTTHVRHPLPPGQPSQPPPPDPALHPGRAAASAGGGPRWRRPQVLVPAAVGFLALVGIAAVVAPPPDTQVVAGSSSSSTTVDEPATSATTAAPTTEPPTTEPSTTAAPATEPPTTAPPTTEAPTTTVAPTTTTTTRPPTTRPPTTKRPTTVAPATTTAIKPLVGGGCDPNYTGACVPIASDVDCAGGKGNGPAYVQGPVRVVGSDIYDLDGNDNDGIGCE